MKKLFTLFFALVATTALWAHNFSAGGIYYNILTDNEVEVTYRGSHGGDYNEYYGSVTIPETVTYNGTTYSVTSIGWDAFAYCSDLTSITIPNSITSIGNQVFYDCSALTSITIPNSVTSIGNHAFHNTGIYNNESNWKNGVLYISNCLIEAKDISGAYIIKEGTRLIADGAFANCSGLTSVTIPNSVTTIGDGAFSGCSGLKSPVYNAHCFAYMPTSYSGAYAIPEGIKQIADGAFANCSGLTSVTIPNSVTSIGGGVFVGCSSLTSITIPNSVTSIGSSAFFGCSGLTSATIGNSVTTIGDYAFYNCSSLTSITIPNSVKSIGESAFSGCSSLTSVTIPNSVANIGESAFSDCSGLTSATIGNSVTTIGDYAFYNCSSLTSITIPNSVTSIGGSAFSGCSGLTSVTIGNRVTSIGDYAFYDCSGLTSITIPNSVTSIGRYAFSGCKKITSITIPDNVKNIGENTFTSCTGLTSVTIPNSVANIGESAFSDCSGLTSATIGNSVTTIGDYAFYNCSSLTFIESLAEVPPTLGTDAFYNVPKNIPIYVLSSSVSAYQSAEGWKLFTNIQEQIITYELNGGVTNDDNWLGKADMWAAFSTDAGISVGTLDEVKANKDPFTLICGKLLDANVTTIMGMEKWDWLEAYVMTIQNVDADATALVEGTSSAGWRYALAAFFLESHRTSWPKSTDFSVAGKVEAFMPAWKHGFANPTEPTGEWVLNAPYKEGYTFAGWYATPDFSGDIVTTVNAETTGTLYAKWLYTSTPIISVYSYDESMGTVTGGGTYVVGDYAEISATANYGYHFSYWNDGNTDNPRVVQVTEDKTYTAYFDNNTYSITKQYDAEQGSITGPTSGKYLDVITLTATPKYGYHFTQWSDGVTTNPRSFVLTKDTTFAAFFTVNQYQLSTSSNNPEAGTVSGAGTYDYNTYAEISATANYGYHFSYWNDGNTDNPRIVKVTGDKTYTAYFNKNTYIVSVDYNSAYGTVTGPTSGEYMDELTLTATPNLGYVFVGWSDGVKDNPRTIVLNKDIRLTANFAQAYSGQCGDNLYWAYDEANKKISITGSGNMYDYTKSTQPWLLFQEQITEVTTSNTTSSIGTSAFEGCIRLGKVSLGYGMGNIAAKAFAECKRLYDIYVYASYPPFAEESSFANYNVYLYVPCENQRDYILDVVWGNFKYIECIGAESDDTGGDDVTVTPGTNDVTITWPTEDEAETYSIVIKKDGKVVCTLTFNSEGQLLNIAFAPGREGNHPAQYAEATTNGYRFTVTGLEEGTDYTYTVTSKDAVSKTLSEHSGEFTTQSNISTDIFDSSHPITNSQKLIRNGQLIIIRDGVEYNAMGQEL